MKRRKFIRQSAAASTLVGLGVMGIQSCAGNTSKHITILHTNDVHSHIDAFPSDHSRFANLGGLARRATLVEQIRKENPNTLLFDAGDIFQGTPYFNFYGGELEFKLMSMLKYDAATIGNHDFDNGLDGLAAQMPHASFKMLSANYDFKNTLMEGMVEPFKVFLVDGIKIGVYGLGIELAGLVSKKLYKETQYQEPYGIAQDTERHLKEVEKCDLVVCLSHIGYAYTDGVNLPHDLELAKQTSYTDLIIGGHTHTFLDKPTAVENKVGKTILVNQVGCYGLRLGRIDFYLGTDTTSGGVSLAV
jgi:5'-nucleotidase